MSLLLSHNASTREGEHPGPPKVAICTPDAPVPPKRGSCLASIASYYPDVPPELFALPCFQSALRARGRRQEKLLRCIVLCTSSIKIQETGISPLVAWGLQPRFYALVPLWLLSSCNNNTKKHRHLDGPDSVARRLQHPVPRNSAGFCARSKKRTRIQQQYFANRDSVCVRGNGYGSSSASECQY